MKSSEKFFFKGKKDFYKTETTGVSNGGIIDKGHPSNDGYFKGDTVQSQSINDNLGGVNCMKWRDDGRGYILGNTYGKSFIKVEASEEEMGEERGEDDDEASVDDW